MEYILWRVLRF